LASDVTSLPYVSWRSARAPRQVGGEREVVQLHALRRTSVTVIPVVTRVSDSTVMVADPDRRDAELETVTTAGLVVNHHGATSRRCPDA
jgi:hypothetical protein